MLKRSFYTRLVERRDDHKSYSRSGNETRYVIELGHLIHLECCIYGHSPSSSPLKADLARRVT